MNYYKLFDLPISPIVNKDLVAKKYVELQKQHHPDFFSEENEHDQENALEISAQINKAYQIFKNSDKTLEYFLQINDCIKTDEKYNLPTDFLMEMMELNELIDENRQTPETINSIIHTIENEGKALLTLDSSLNTGKNKLEKLKLFYYKKKYLHRILERLND